MNYTDAQKLIKKGGVAHATGDAKRAVYADAVSYRHAVTPKSIYVWLQRHAATDEEIHDKAAELLRDGFKASDAALEGMDL